MRNPKSASIGDSVMELAGRTMLGGYDVDLLTHKGTDELFKTDRHFKNVFTEPGAVDPRRYDFVLLDLFNTNSIKLKSRICAPIPLQVSRVFSMAAITTTCFSVVTGYTTCWVIRIRTGSWPLS